MGKKKYYGIWKEYDSFIKSLHIEKEEKKFSVKFFWSYLKKLIVIFVASFITSFSFQLLMQPNGIYNTGINGIIQVVNWYFSAKNINIDNYYYYYYGSVFLVNVILILFTEFFIPGNFSVNSTSLFYIIFQIFWSTIFERTNIKNQVFSRLRPKSWNHISSQNQLGLTLPFYVLIAMSASYLHTWGYSLIYRAKSSPGGLDIITSTISQKNQKETNKKKKKTIFNLSMLFSFSVVFFITIFNFIFVEGNMNLTTNQLIKEINNDRKERMPYALYFFEDEIRNKEDFFRIIKNGKDSSERKERKIGGIPIDHEEMVENLKFKLNSFLNLKSENIEIITNYLQKGRKYLYEHYKEEIKKVRVPSSNLNTPIDFIIGYDKNEKFENYNQKKTDGLIVMKDSIGDSMYEWSDFLKYSTNDEKLWGSIVYIIFSSYIMKSFFPKNKIIEVRFSIDDSQIGEIKKILKDYETYYFYTTHIIDEVEKRSIIFCCFITKWNYSLISEDLKNFNRIAILETDEKN